MRRLLPDAAGEVDLEAAYAVDGALPWHVRVSLSLIHI